MFAATSPNGGLYRIENGQAQEVWHSPAKYLWSLQPMPDGAIFIGTGEGGRIYRYDGQNQTSVYYETGQTNVTSLAAGPAGHLYAGSDPNGLIYDITGTGRATVLYDSSLPEIRAISVAADGTVYAAAMGGAVATRTAAATQPTAAASPTVVATTPTVITVTTARESDNDPATKVPDPSEKRQLDNDGCFRGLHDGRH